MLRLLCAGPLLRRRYAHWLGCICAPTCLGTAPTSPTLLLVRDISLSNSSPRAATPSGSHSPCCRIVPLRRTFREGSFANQDFSFSWAFPYTYSEFHEAAGRNTSNQFSTSLGTDSRCGRIAPTSHRRQARLSLSNFPLCSHPPIATMAFWPNNKRPVLPTSRSYCVPWFVCMHVPAPYRRSLRKTGIVPAVAPFTKRKKGLGGWVSSTGFSPSIESPGTVGSLLPVVCFLPDFITARRLLCTTCASSPRFGISTADHPWLVFRNERHRAVFGHLVFGLVPLHAKVCDAF